MMGHGTRDDEKREEVLFVFCVQCNWAQCCMLYLGVDMINDVNVADLCFTTIVSTISEIQLSRTILHICRSPLLSEDFVNSDNSKNMMTWRDLHTGSEVVDVWYILTYISQWDGDWCVVTNDMICLWRHLHDARYAPSFIISSSRSWQIRSN